MSPFSIDTVARVSFFQCLLDSHVMLFSNQVEGFATIVILKVPQ